MTKTDYFNRGVSDAIDGNVLRRIAYFCDGTWQALAYKAGYDSIKGMFAI
jgi:hypothetical protein